MGRANDMIEEAPRCLTLPDGCRLAYRRYGANNGAPVIALHGTPGFGLKFGFAARVAAERGITLICPDRWGYGGSDAPLRTRRTLKHFAEDMDVLAEAEGHGDCVGLLAVSGGAPFAVATAAYLGDRVDRLGLVSSVGPIISMPKAGEPTVASMTMFHHFCFRALPRIPGALEGLFAGFGVIARWKPDLAMAVATARAAPADRQLMQDEAERRSQAKVFGGGLSGGALGPAIDLRLFSRPWNVSFDRIVAQTKIWQGTADRNVPVDAARRLSRDIHHAEFNLIENAGHCWIAQNAGHVMDWYSANSEDHGAS